MLTIMSCTTPSPSSPQGSPETDVEHRARGRRSARPRAGCRSTAAARALAGPTRPGRRSAPKVTISPCAKFEMPVVPKTSDRPIAASASIRPKLRPCTSRCRNWSKKLVTLRSPSPMKKLTITRPPRPTSTSFTFGVSSSVDDRDALGQRRLVERDRVVLVLLGNADAPLAVLVGLDLLLAAGAVDRQRHAFEGLTVELHVAADAVRVALGCRRAACARARRVRQRRRT